MCTCIRVYIYIYTCVCAKHCHQLYKKHKRMHAVYDSNPDANCNHDKKPTSNNPHLGAMLRHLVDILSQGGVMLIPSWRHIGAKLVPKGTQDFLKNDHKTTFKILHLHLVLVLVTESKLGPHSLDYLVYT